MQRALHPVTDLKTDEASVTEAYDTLREYVEQAVKREGLL
jgi:hypothetical protein